jgi:hypothetical protein
MKIIIKYLVNNNLLDTLNRDKNKQSCNIKFLSQIQDKINKNIIKSLYYQGILTHYWLFMYKSIIYNHKKYASGIFSYRFAKYHFQKTDKKYIYFDIYNEKYRVKTYGYILIFTETDKMFSIEIARENNLKNIQKYIYSPCMIIKEFRNLFKKYFKTEFKYSMFPTTLSYNKRIQYYYEQKTELFDKFIDEYKNKYSNLIKNYILENNEDIIKII